MIKKITLNAIMACALLFNISVSADTFDYDGHYDAAQYDKAFSINYFTDDGKTEIKGGVLAFANDGGNQYVYISHPKGFKDLSYGGKGAHKGQKVCDKKCAAKIGKDAKKAAELAAKALCANGNAGKQCRKDAKESAKQIGKDAENAARDDSIVGGGGDQYNVGWGNGNGNSKDADGAIGSEHFTLTFQFGGEDYEVKFDPEVPGGTKVSSVSKDAVKGADISFLSTLDYNASIVSDDGTLGAFSDHSPETVTCNVDNQGNVDLDNETSSDPSCYQLADTDENKDADGNLYEWDFNFGIEIMLESQIFDIASLSVDSFAHISDDNADSALIRLDALHASPAKSSCDSDKHDVCSATVVPPTEVPEPTTLAVFALALGLLRIQAKRRNG